MKLDLKQSASFPLKFRVPAWTHDFAVKVNGEDIKVAATPGTWAVVERKWNSGDRVEVRIPLTLRMQAVDKQHPDRVAVVRGPVVLVLETAYHDAHFRLPDTDAELNQWLVADNSPRAQPGSFAVKPPDGSAVRSSFRPFYTVEEAYPYRCISTKNRCRLVSGNFIGFT